MFFFSGGRMRCAVWSAALECIASSFHGELGALHGELRPLAVKLQ
jgi:hypothetical protein